MPKCITFKLLAGHSINQTEDESGDVKLDPDVRLRRQNLLRDQGLLQLLLSMVNMLIPISQLTDITVPEKSKAEKTEERLVLIEMGREALEACFSLLYESIVDHPVNQMYVADFIPVLLAHLGKLLIL